MVTLVNPELALLYTTSPGNSDNKTPPLFLSLCRIHIQLHLTLLIWKVIANGI